MEQIVLKLCVIEKLMQRIFSDVMYKNWNEIIPVEKLMIIQP